MKRPLEKDYFEFRGKTPILSEGACENFIESQDEYIDHIEFHLAESQSDVSTQAIIIAKLEKQNAKLKASKDLEVLKADVKKLMLKDWTRTEVTKLDEFMEDVIIATMQVNKLHINVRPERGSNEK